MSSFITYSSQLAHLEDLHRRAAERGRFASPGLDRHSGRTRLVRGRRAGPLRMRLGVILRRVFSPPGLG